MTDFLAFCLQKYYTKIGWDENSLYSNLCSASTGLGIIFVIVTVIKSNRLFILSELAILDFSLLPSPIDISIGKSISPQLKSSYHIGLPNSRSAGFLTTSFPLHVSRNDEDNTNIEKGSDHYLYHQNNASETESSNNQFQKHFINKKKPWLLYARIFEDLRLEAQYTQSLSPQKLMIVSALSSWSSSHASHVSNEYSLRLKEILKKHWI